MDPCIPIPIPDDELEELVEKAKDFALMHGKKNKSEKVRLIIVVYSRYLHATEEQF